MTKVTSLRDAVLMNINRVVFSYVPLSAAELNVVEFNWIDHFFNVRKADEVYRLKDEDVASKIITFVNEHLDQLTEGDFEKHEFDSKRYYDVKVYVNETSRLIKTDAQIAAFIDEIFLIPVKEEQRIDLKGVFVSVDKPYQPNNDNLYMANVMGGMSMQSAMVDPRYVGTNNTSVDPWDCTCGNKGNTGKFCPNCGMPYNKAK